ncbi:MAG TPA: antitoxin [Trebonia sp.]
MPEFGELFEKAKELAEQHPDQLHQGVEKIEELADGKLGGKFSGQVEQAGNALEGFLGVHHQQPTGETPAS